MAVAKDIAAYLDVRLLARQRKKPTPTKYPGHDAVAKPAIIRA